MLTLKMERAFARVGEWPQTAERDPRLNANNEMGILVPITAENEIPPITRMRLEEDLEFLMKTVSRHLDFSLENISPLEPAWTPDAQKL